MCVLQHEPLYRACEKGDLVKVRWLIDEGADVNWRNKKEVLQCLQCITDCSFSTLNCSDSATCLHITAKKGRTKILNYLIDQPDVITEICDAVSVT